MKAVGGRIIIWLAKTSKEVRSKDGGEKEN